MAVSFQNVSFKYDPKQASYTLEDLTFLIPSSNEMVFVLGHTGSGKSTLVQLMNALLLPASGEIKILDHSITSHPLKNKKAIRRDVGLVFQFPEYQLFEESVIKDIAFGPKNFGANNADALQKAKETCDILGIDKALYDRSPFTLSGGQMRKVGLAGILASRPSILLLDEPTVGLDATSKENLFNTLNDYQTKGNKTIFIVSHDMNLAYQYATLIIILNKGKIAYIGSKQALFNDFELLKQNHLDLPDIAKIALAFKAKGIIDFTTLPQTKEELIKLLDGGKYE